MATSPVTKDAYPPSVEKVTTPSTSGGVSFHFIMALWHDVKYLRLVSSQLDQFKQKHEHTFNFRCPLCGDSEKNTTKARGYVFPVGQKLIFKCHNCSVSVPFSNLLKTLHPGMWHEYLLEILQDNGQAPRAAQNALPAAPVVPQARIPRAMDLDPLAAAESPESPLHAAYAYAKSRLLPDCAYTRLFATDKARSWALPLIGEEKVKKVQDGPVYLVQPLRLPDGEWFGAQLRHLTQKDYLTFRWSHDPLKVFGLEDHRAKELTYVVEGPMDALFIPNAIAACGSDLHSAMTIAENAGHIKPTDRRVYVWDNEPRNKEVTKHIRNAIKLGEQVVIWPKDYPKDINDMVKAGMPVRTVWETMKNRTFSGLLAELEFEAWKA